MALGVGLAHGYLRQAFSNIGGLFLFWWVQGVRPVPALTLEARQRSKAAICPAHFRRTGGDAMATLTRGRRWGSERGAELIEMVVVTPLLLLLLFGIIDFGFLFQKYVVLTNAAMEGARVGMLPGYTNADAQVRATTYAAAGGVQGTVNAVATPVTVPGAGGGTWPAVRVTVTHLYTYPYIGPIMGLFNGSFSSVTLTASSTMRKQLGS